MVHVLTRQFGDLDSVCVALQAKTSQALPAVLVGKVEVPHQVLCGRLLHVQLISILLVEEAHFLQQVINKHRSELSACEPTSDVNMREEQNLSV